MAEIDVVIQYLRKLTTGNIRFKQNRIGVITPFKLQEKYLKERFISHKYYGVSVGTVEVFQGQERDVIILSTVRTRMFRHDNKVHIGFLDNTKRFNVAMTRAKALLIVIGNPNVLKYNASWKRFITYCIENKACTGDAFSLTESDAEIVQLYSQPISYVSPEDVENHFSSEQTQADETVDNKQTVAKKVKSRTCRTKRRVHSQNQKENTRKIDSPNKTLAENHTCAEIGVPKLPVVDASSANNNDYIKQKCLSFLEGMEPMSTLPDDDDDTSSDSSSDTRNSTTNTEDKAAYTTMLQKFKLFFTGCSK